ncbi:MAG TPA: choice-of-anchor D domain-containing protein [Casimicrobiaceae bacterium]|nr:choice-of-anchor D domain-containing protein [Casimicrobiaceae bacterium]
MSSRAWSRILKRYLFLLCLLGLACGASAQGRLCASQQTLIFGNEPVGGETHASVTVSNCGNAAWSFIDVSIDPATGAGWQVTTGCSAGLALAPGAACNVSVTFVPRTTGQTSGGLWLHNTSDDPDVLIAFYGRGVDAEAGTASLSFSPAALSFPPQAVGTASPSVTVTLLNAGPAKLKPSALVINGPAAYDYSATGGTCFVGAAVQPGSSCTLTFVFTPSALGNRPANLVVDAPQLANLAILSIGGTGSVATTPPPADADVVEFVYPPANHYFLTASPEEAAALDASGLWVRTGYHFRAWSAGNAAPGTLPACRFTGTPGIGPNSHFFTADANECAIVATNPYWVFEGIAFRSALPDAGACSAGSVPVIRFFLTGSDVTQVRHRYVVDPAEAARMRTAGWFEEGPVFCAPS